MSTALPSIEPPLQAAAPQQVGSALYVCYQSLLDPLTHTQVVAYLEGLAGAGHRVALLTFEPRRLSNDETDRLRRRLAALGIQWHWRRYHKRPTVPATFWDIFVGVIAGLWLVRKYRVDILHARAHVPGVMTWIVKRLTGAKMLFDIRGFMAEEYVDAGVWPAGGRLFRATKSMERRLVGAADALVVLTHPAAALITEWYPEETRNKPLSVIPCCVDLRHETIETTTSADDHGVGPTIVYVGKLGGWYLTETMVEFVASAMQVMAGLRWQVWTQSDPKTLRELVEANGISDHVSIGRAAADELPAKLREAVAGLSLIKPCLSKQASSPTKVGEYLAAGLPVVANHGIGDLDLLLDPDGNSASAVGVLVDLDPQDRHRASIERLKELVAGPTIRARCRTAAVEHLDLQGVGWSRYRSLYQQILNSGVAAR